MNSFHEKLNHSVSKRNSLVCVGLDPIAEKLPLTIGGSFLEFNKRIVDATHDVVSAYKPNPAFYEAYGAPGVQILKDTCTYIQTNHPDIPIIIDAKRGDIGHTNAGYAKYVFEYLNADAVTIMPYMGIESLDAFFTYADRGLIVGCHSSNPGACEFQEIQVNGTPLYHIVAETLVKKHGTNPNTMIFMGATFPQQLVEIRKIVGDMTLLVPGIGAQGGNVETFVKAGKNSMNQGLIINSSRAILYASSGDDFAKRAREEAMKLRDEINTYR
jgi:orotidine-5'-phosphate decarboxylase